MFIFLLLVSWVHWGLLGIYLLRLTCIRLDLSGLDWALLMVTWTGHGWSSMYLLHLYNKGITVTSQYLNSYLALSAALHVICPCPMSALCSTPLLSDRTVYSGHVGWGVLFSRASCFAAAPKCLFLFQISRDLFGLRNMGVCLCQGRNWLWFVCISHEVISHHQTLKRSIRLRGRLGFRSHT